MKTKNKFKSRVKHIKNKAKTIVYKNMERVASFIKATIEQKPLLSLFNGIEKSIENTFDTLEYKSKKRKIKRIENKKEKQRIQEHLEQAKENEIPQHIFLERLEELKKRLPIKQLKQDTTLER